jgi:hypothetical protein
MDNLSFLKLQPVILRKEFDIDLTKLIETDLNNQLLVSMVEPYNSNSPELFIGFSNSKSEYYLMKALAYHNELRD